MQTETTLLAGPADVSLTAPDRYLLSQLLPRQGTRQQMRLADSIDKTIAFDESERGLYGIRFDEQGAMYYDATAATDTLFSFDTGQLDLIRQCIDAADAEGRIARTMLPLLAKLDTLLTLQ